MNLNLSDETLKLIGSVLGSFLESNPKLSELLFTTCFGGADIDQVINDKIKSQTADFILSSLDDNQAGHFKEAIKQSFTLHIEKHSAELFAKYLPPEMIEEICGNISSEGFMDLLRDDARDILVDACSDVAAEKISELDLEEIVANGIDSREVEKALDTAIETAVKDSDFETPIESAVTAKLDTIDIGDVAAEVVNEIVSEQRARIEKTLDIVQQSLVESLKDGGVHIRS